jgi:hypothetical protein
VVLHGATRPLTADFTRFLFDFDFKKKGAQTSVFQPL